MPTLQSLDELPPATSAVARQGTMVQMAVVESVCRASQGSLTNAALADLKMRLNNPVNTHNCLRPPKQPDFFGVSYRQLGPHALTAFRAGVLRDEERLGPGASF